MKDVGIRERKARASSLLRRVAEGGAIYTITHRGRAVGVLAPPSFVAPVVKGAGDLAWARLNRLADDLGRNRAARVGPSRADTDGALRWRSC